MQTSEDKASITQHRTVALQGVETAREHYRCCECGSHNVDVTMFEKYDSDEVLCRDCGMAFELMNGVNEPEPGTYIEDRVR